MSFRVLVIPEDFTKDEAVVKPIIAAMMRHLGKTQARVSVCTEPRLGGIGQALNKELIANIVRDFPMMDLYILCVDRDGVEERRLRLDNIETHVRESCDRNLLAVNAWQEIEVWLLAAVTDLPSKWSWEEIRAEVDLKETYFEPYIDERGLNLLPDQGRGDLGRAVYANYQRIYQLCPEDIQNLQGRLSP